MTFFTVPEAAQDTLAQALNCSDDETLTNVAASCCSGIYSDNDSSLETESESRRSVLNLDSAVGVGCVISVQSQEGSRLESQLCSIEESSSQTLDAHVWNTRDAKSWNPLT
jgi:hypothetical protein